MMGYRKKGKEKKRKITAELNSYIRNAPSSTCKVQLKISLCLESDSQSFFVVGREWREGRREAMT